MRVTILSGASGSGKSTWAMAVEQPATIVSADHFFMKDLCSSGITEYQFDPSQLPDAHAQCLRDFLDCLTVGIEHVVVDNTNTTVAEVAPYHALAQAFGYDVVIRQFTGEYDNVHGVPAKAVENMRKRAGNLKRFAPPWWQFVEGNE